MYAIYFLFLFFLTFPQQGNTEQIIIPAFNNAKKGIYWGLSQSSLKQNLIKNNLIDNDKLISEIRVEKAVNGLHIESKGYYEGCEVTVSIYKSNDNLIKEGYLVIPKPDTLNEKGSAKKKKRK